MKPFTLPPKPAWTAGFFVLLASLLILPPLQADEEHSIDDTVQALQTEWEDVFYGLPAAQQADRYAALLDKLDSLAHDHPAAASPKVLKAMVLCTYAGTRVGLSSLEWMEEARDLLRQAIQMDPRSLNGSAWITLGNLYQRLPGWPVSFGDNTLAREYLGQAIKLFPSAMDTNYFYGNFLLEQGEYDEALKYLQKAASVPLSAEAGIAEKKLQEQVSTAITAAREHHAAGGDFFSRILPDWIASPEH